MPDGILIIDKPTGWTSMDVCGKLRGILKTKKVGHAGTLDPMATGVLPVFVGQATRAVSFAESGDKEYVAGLRLGCTTNTQDTSGETPEEISTAACVMLPDIILAGDLNIFRSSKIDGRIMSYILNHIVNGQIARIAQGKSVVHIQASEISKIEISYPDYYTQCKMISVFETVGARIKSAENELTYFAFNAKGSGAAALYIKSCCNNPLFTEESKSIFLHSFSIR